MHVYLWFCISLFLTKQNALVFTYKDTTLEHMTKNKNNCCTSTPPKKLITYTEGEGLCSENIIMWPQTKGGKQASYNKVWIGYKFKSLLYRGTNIATSKYYLKLHLSMAKGRNCLLDTSLCTNRDNQCDRASADSLIRGSLSEKHIKDLQMP